MSLFREPVNTAAIIRSPSNVTTDSEGTSFSPSPSSERTGSLREERLPYSPAILSTLTTPIASLSSSVFDFENASFSSSPTHEGNAAFNEGIDEHNVSFPLTQPL